jgi:hypothetical protein
MKSPIHPINFLFITLFLLMSVTAQSQTVLVDGSVFLSDQALHAGISVYFEPLSPSSRERTIESQNDGSWFAQDINIGIYNIRFSKEGYVPGIIPNVFIDKDTTFAAVSLRPGGTAEIAGSVFGVRENGVVTLSGDTLYTVTGDLTVTGERLVIEAGAELQFRRDTGLSIINGVLEIQGTAADSVIFSSGQPVPDVGDWKGITIQGGSGHRLNHAWIGFAQTGLMVSNATDVKVESVRNTRTLLNSFPARFHTVQGLEIRNSWFTGSERPVLDTRDVTGLLLEGNTFFGGANQVQLVRVRGGALIRGNQFLQFVSVALISSEHGPWGNGGGTNDNFDAGGIRIEDNHFETALINNITIFLTPYQDVSVTGNTAFFNNKTAGNSEWGFAYARTGVYHENDIRVENASKSGTNNYWLFWFGRNGDITDNTINVHYDGQVGFHRLMGNGQSNVAREAVVTGNKISITGTFLYAAHGNNAIELRSIRKFSDNTFVSYASNNDYQYNENFRFNFYDVEEVSGNTIASVGGRYSSSYHQPRLDFTARAGHPMRVEHNYISLPNRNWGDVAVTLRGPVSFRHNVLEAPGGIGSYSQPREAEIAHNIILGARWPHNSQSSFGIRILESSLAIVRNNTLIADPQTRTGNGIQIDGNARPVVVNNHVEGYINGIIVNSEPVELLFNNIINTTTPFSGSVSIPFIGLMSTVNHLGTPSDIYYNTASEAGFIQPFNFQFNSSADIVAQVRAGTFHRPYSGTYNYGLLPDSPHINAGSDRFMDPDGTRSDIGALYFDFGNPKNLSLVEALDGGFTVRFEPVERDSVIAYRVYAAKEGEDLVFVQTVAATDTDFTLTNLENNVPYTVAMKAQFTNSESILSALFTFRPGVPQLEILTPRMVVVHQPGEQGIGLLQLRNSGTRDLEVQVAHDISPFSTSATPAVSDYTYRGLFNNKHWYYHSSGWSGLNWHSSKAFAEQRGLQLAIIRSAEENAFARQGAANNRVWLGAYKGTECDNTFTWIDGTPLTYSNFASGEPNNPCNERALEMQSNGLWYDLGETNGLRHLATAQAAMGHNLSQSSVIIPPGETITIADTLLSPTNVYLLDYLRITSNDLSRGVDSVLVVQVAGLNTGLPPVYFDEVTGTGNGHLVVLESAKVDDTVLVAGDEIALYSGNTLVGSASYTGVFPMLLQAWNFIPDDSIRVRIYLSATGELVDVTPDIRRGSQVFIEDGYSVITAPGTLRVPNQLVLPANRFNLISLYVNPPNRQVTTLFSNTQTLILHDDEGQVWIPGFNINQIGNWNAERGYYLFRSGQDTVRTTINGRPLLRNETPIHLYGNRFNYIPVIYDAPEPVTSAFAEFPTGRISIIQDDEGGAWIPSLDLNTLGSLQPGKGYLMFLSGADTTFTYPDPVLAKQAPVQPVLASAYYSDKVVATGLPWTVVITQWDALLPQNAEISLWDGDVLVGATTRTGDTTAVTVWRADPDNELPGFAPGNPVTARVWDAQQQVELEVRLTDTRTSAGLRFGSGAFGIAAAGAPVTTGIENELPIEYALEAIYPNPFNPSTNVRFSLPETAHVRITVYNTLGQLVATLSDGMTAQGRHTITWNAINQASGVYIIRLEAGNFVQVRHVTLLK